VESKCIFTDVTMSGMLLCDGAGSVSKAVMGWDVWDRWDVWDGCMYVCMVYES
jgi:hypothetical protein